MPASKKILLYGDSFLIGHVIPDPKTPHAMKVGYSGGGALLLYHAILGISQALASKKLPNGQADPALSITLQPPEKKEGQTTNLPMRLVHRMRSYEKGEGPEKPRIYMMAEMADTNPSQAIVDESDRPRFPAPSGKEESETGNSSGAAEEFYHLTIERRTDVEASPSQPPPGLTCDYFLRVASPILHPSRAPKGGPEDKVAITVNRGLCVITTAAQVAEQTNIRVRSSLEDVCVDLTRWIRRSEALPFLLGVEPKGKKNGPNIPPRFNLKSDLPLIVIFRLLGGPLLYYRRTLKRGTYLDFETSTNNDHPSAWLVFDRRCPAFVQTVGQGRVRGTGSLVAGQVAATIEQIFEETNSDATGQREFSHLKLPLDLTNAYFQDGIPEKDLVINKQKEFQLNTTGYFKKLSKRNPRNIPSEDILCLRLPLDVLESSRIKWSLAADYIKTQDDSNPPSDTQIEDFALNLLSEEKDAPLKNLPLVRYKKLPLIDRDEIEDYLALQNILISYLESGAAKPLNLAVFGPPGSGKSFGTKQLLEHIGGNSKKFQEKPAEFNMAQFNKVSDLAEALHVVRNEGMGEAIPVAFFDEFDCAFGGQPYGWLQYLLAPMQDGQFWDDNQVFKLGRCVFVFAGGVNRRFEEFNGRVRDPSFCAAKGPDFISRLRGVLNIRGVNKQEEDNDKERYLLRRAVLLRSMLEEFHKNAEAPVPKQLMGKSLAGAFMKVEGFKHGNRSMEAILRMCNIRPGYTLHASDLPPPDQLEMHVDARRFTELIEPGPDDLKPEPRP